MMRLIVILCFMLMPMLASSQKIIHLGYYKGHLSFETIASNNKQIRVVIDTGARTSLAFSDILIYKVRNPKSYVGVGFNIIGSDYDGLLVTRDFCARASYINQRKSYDAILGLDWLVAHNANINLSEMTLEYE